MQAAASPRSATLRRVLGSRDATALVVSNIIGVGIFTTPGIVAQMVPAPWAMLALWAAGGVLAFAGAVAYAELAALRPYAGAEYVYLHDAFGPLAGFLTGWTSFIAGFSGAIAAGAIGWASYLGRFFPAAAGAHRVINVPLRFVHAEISYRTLLAVGLILVVSTIHIFGLGVGRTAQNVLAGTLVVALVGLILWGFMRGHGSAAHLASAGPWNGRRWLLALIPVMFTYSGWNAAAYVAEEVRTPERNLWRALALGTGTIIVLYIALNLLYLYALAPEQMAGVINVGDAAATALFGRVGASLVTALTLIALAGGVSAMALAGPRVYFAMARDGVFVPAAARVHPRFHTPAVAIAAQALWSAILVVTGGFEQLLIYTGFAVVLFSGLAMVALFVLRRREKERRVAGISLVAAGVFAFASLAMLISAIMEKPKTSAVGLLLIAGGLPVYLWSRKRRVKDDAAYVSRA